MQVDFNVAFFSVSAFKPDCTKEVRLFQIKKGVDAQYMKYYNDIKSENYLCYRLKVVNSAYPVATVNLPELVNSPSGLYIIDEIYSSGAFIGINITSTSKVLLDKAIYVTRYYLELQKRTHLNSKESEKYFDTKPLIDNLLKFL